MSAPQRIPSQDAQNMFTALKSAFDKFLQEYTAMKGTDEISDLELKAAGQGFKDIANEVVATNNKRIEAGNTEGVRLVHKDRITLVPAAQRVTLTPAERR
jgi:hypothetical protein